MRVSIPGLCPPSPNTLTSEHWTKRRARVERTKLLVLQALGARKKPDLPVKVTIYRSSHHRIDKDNAWMSMKAVTDGIAHWLGVDDGDETKVVFEVVRENGPPGTHIKMEAK